ncbi:hypothetical protein DICVIV_06181 [Dictyocaulus viviparus]|uniref:Uncharacterized protein n=1 Tax=Dictyocaulus viviparus TaxID=29172 RepID=A0A0D8XVC2_DICVI|nr:hypothetical protein DICVIV_06181 [Dictyocaulus viviparus]
MTDEESCICTEMKSVRYLAPYWAAYRTRTKGRWIGRKMVDVFAQEFLSLNKNYPWEEVKTDGQISLWDGTQEDENVFLANTCEIVECVRGTAASLANNDFKIRKTFLSFWDAPRIPFTISACATDKLKKIACKLGRIYVNNQQMLDVDYVLKNGDSILHWGHRHEHPKCPVFFTVFKMQTSSVRGFDYSVRLTHTFYVIFKNCHLFSPNYDKE